MENCMTRHRFNTPLLVAGALALAAGSPALAGKSDRAREAIAAAQAKLDSARTAGAGTELPHQVAQSDAELKRAREALATGHKDEAIDIAIHASALADAALGESQKRKQADAAAAQQAAQMQASAAQQQVDAARQQAEQANARADQAQQAANAAASQAQAASLAAAAQATAAPAQVETTVTTAQAASPHRTVVRKRVVTKKAAAPAAVTTTTRVTTGQ